MKWEEEIVRCNVLDRRCISRKVLSLLTSRWNLLVLYALQPHPLRFSELHRRIDGISARMLSRALNQLDTTGLVEKTSLSETSSLVQYKLSSLGKGIAEEAQGLVTWVEKNAQKLHPNDFS